MQLRNGSKVENIKTWNKEEEEEEEEGKRRRKEKGQRKDLLYGPGIERENKKERGGL